jgi:hypothetical protein
VSGRRRASRNVLRSGSTSGSREASESAA